MGLCRELIDVDFLRFISGISNDIVRILFYVFRGYLNKFIVILC